MIRLAALLTALACPAMAAQCGAHDDFRDGLAKAYGEVLVAMGQAGAQPPRMIEFYANPSNGTWTVIQTDPAGVSCIAATRDRGQIIPPGVPS